jgi:hypothetical protein
MSGPEMGFYSLVGGVIGMLVGQALWALGCRFVRRWTRYRSDLASWRRAGSLTSRRKPSFWRTR